MTADRGRRGRLGRAVTTGVLLAGGLLTVPVTAPAAAAAPSEGGHRPVASWSLADDEGSAQAAGGHGAGPATAGPGVAFGVQGPYSSGRKAAWLDGTEGAYLDTGQHVVDTDESFSIAAWVRIPEVPTTSMAVVSQDGSAHSGFVLGVDGHSGRWSFATPDSELGAMVDWEVLGPRVDAGDWTHLVGVYDAEDGAEPGTLRMYVDGQLVEEDIQSRSTVWNAVGDLQIGRALEMAGHTAHLRGRIGRVVAFDRAVTAGEAADLAGAAAFSERAYWHMEQPEDGTVPDLHGGAGLRLHGDASVYAPVPTCDPFTDPTCVPPAEPLWGEGHLQLTGSGHAARGPGLLEAGTGFTVTVRARLGSYPAAQDQTVFSLPGSTRSAVLVRYDGDSARWQLEVTSEDSAEATTGQAVVEGVAPRDEAPGDHLALAYDALLGELHLYVNSQWAAAITDWHHEWDFSTVGLQLGRTGSGPSGAEFFSGALDEVRVFDGALEADLINTVSVLPSGSSLGPGVS